VLFTELLTVFCSRVFLLVVVRNDGCDVLWQQRDLSHSSSPWSRPLLVRSTAACQLHRTYCSIIPKI